MKSITLSLLLFVGIFSGAFASTQPAAFTSIVANANITCKAGFLTADAKANTLEVVESTPSEGNFKAVGFKRSKALQSCTIRIEGETADGKTYSGTVTVSDVSWVNCQAMKLSAWWDRNF